jgi:hypothetical protein
MQVSEQQAIVLHNRRPILLHDVVDEANMPTVVQRAVAINWKLAK